MAHDCRQRTCRHVPTGYTMKADARNFNRREVLELAAAAALLCVLPLGASDALAQGAKKPKIGMIGSGKVGSNLGRVLANAGYEVMFSSRNLDDDRKLAGEIGNKARAGTVQEAAAFGDVLFLSVPYAAIPELGKSLGSALKGKVVIDASNPIVRRDGEEANQWREEGAGVVSARLLPGARIVRAFNAVPAARMGEVHTTPGKVAMPIAADDKQAIEIASRVIRDIGFEPVLVGGLAMGKHLLPGTSLAGEHTPAEVRSIAATLKP
jgi:predicted dinucleotide-binding enzyme